MKKLIRRMITGPSIWLATRFPSLATISFMCRASGFLTSGEQVDLIRREIEKRRPCSVLIFGLGNDSAFYAHVNMGGRTVFLEHDAGWIQHVSARYPNLEIYPMSYPTRVDQWREYLKDPAPFAATLPPEIAGVKWDIVFVDAPTGWLPEHPGRMESIRLAREVVRRPGLIFVHDCEREIEGLFSHHFLGKENLRAEVTNLRMYEMK